MILNFIEETFKLGVEEGKKKVMDCLPEKKECYYCLRKTTEGTYNKQYEKFMCITCYEKYKLT